MVVLPEDARALIGVGDRVILEGLFVIRLHGREQDAPAAGFEDAVEFVQRPAVVGDVFEQVVAEDDVDRIIGQRDLLYVEMQVGQRAFEIGRDVLPRMPRKMGFQVAHDADFGRDVERAGKIRQQVGLTCEVEPQQAVAFQRQAFGTERVGP